MREAAGVKRLQAPQHASVNILLKLSVKVPAWVEVLCTELFFNPCNNHENFRKNKEDGFCIDCVESFCCNCLSSHAHHKHLKIRRYVYCEVINRQDLSKFFDCSGIQTYHTNKDRVIFLKQRSQQPSPQCQQTNLRFLHNCIICNRSLQTSLYCSLACKVFAMSRGEHTEEAAQHLIDEKDEDSCDYGGDVIETLPSPKRQKLRKGVALRAPLF
ncbi:putative Zinc ion binding protein [Heracleum sosnowskyi]|uniref:Zinc ion binding protein n=1 Tax=Heracleum sosnowskyi TaxID=360622 RepID=A0AAD8MIK5_9APIA|nr:putative Zinc ion binding protein [Heracleum sosnowskyi]